MQDLWSEKQALEEQQDTLLLQLRQSSVQLAENEKSYRVALAKAILEERAKGTPVSIINDLCRGREDIAQLRFSRDCSEAIYESTKEAINVSKLRYRAVQEQIAREWSAYGNQ